MCGSLLKCLRMIKTSTMHQLLPLQTSWSIRSFTSCSSWNKLEYTILSEKNRLSELGSMEGILEDRIPAIHTRDVDFYYAMKLRAMWRSRRIGWCSTLPRSQCSSKSYQSLAAVFICVIKSPYLCWIFIPYYAQHSPIMNGHMAVFDRMISAWFSWMLDPHVGMSTKCCLAHARTNFIQSSPMVLLPLICRSWCWHHADCEITHFQDTKMGTKCHSDWIPTCSNFWVQQSMYQSNGHRHPGQRLLGYRSTASWAVSNRRIKQAMWISSSTHGHINQINYDLEYNSDLEYNISLGYIYIYSYFLLTSNNIKQVADTYSMCACR